MHTKGIVLPLVTWMSLLCLLAVPARGQNARGSILGNVRDPSGAAVAGARVVLRNAETGRSSEFVTGVPGDYLFFNLIPGTYGLTVTAQGFKAENAQGLMLQVDQTLRQDFILQVGPVTEQVKVEATGAMLQTDNATIGEVTEAQLMQALPLNGRDFTTLIAINAGVTQPAGGIQTGLIFGLHGLNDNWRMSSIDGGRPASISYIIDGVTDNNQFFSNVSAVPSEDAVQEFKLQNGLYSAEYGYGAAQVNVALKTGTNTFHGTAYDFLRNDALQPRNPVIAALNATNSACQAQKTTPPCSPLKPPFKQNQFGVTLGGPVLLPGYSGRGRSFWFFSYEGGRRRVTAGPIPAQVPTAKERTGDFSDWPFPIYDPATTPRTPFLNNQITSGRFNAISQKLLNYFPSANVNCALPCPNFEGFVKSPVDTNVVTTRGDHRLREHDQLTYSMVLAHYNSISGSISPTADIQSFNRSGVFGVGWDHSFSANAVNTARIGYNRLNFHFGAASSFGPNLSQQLGFQNTTPNPAFYGIPSIGLQDGYVGAGTANNGYTQRNNVFQYVDNFRLVRGRHTFAFGADIRRVQMFNTDGFTANGSLTFNGAYTAVCCPLPPNIGQAGADTGNAFADLLLGYPFRAGAPVPIASDLYSLRGTSWGFFFEDDLRVSPRLTLNLGLRYEIPSGLYSKSHSGATINLTTPGGGVSYADPKFVQQITPLLQNPSQAGIYFQCCVPKQLVPVDKHDFAPRVGFAWRPLATSRFVIRGGYGIFYDIYMRFYDGQNYDDNSLTLVQRNPNYPVPTGQETASPLALNTLWLPPVNITSFGLPPSYLFGVQTEWPNNHTPYMQQWSLDTQYQFTPTLMLDVGYVGSRTIHEPIQWHFNAGFPPTVAGDPCNVLRDRAQATGGSASCLTDPNFQPVDTRDPYPNLSPSSFANANILFSNYNSLQTRLRKRFAAGIQFMANYTWSKVLDEGSEIAAFSGEALNLVQDPHNIRGDYGPANFDQAHRLVLSYSYDLPVGRGRKWSLGRANWILGGWNTGGIVTLSSGLPFTVACCFRVPTQFGTAFQDVIRANVSGDPNSGFSQSIFQWFNTSVFSRPPDGRFGNVGRNTLRAPGQYQGDITFSKDTPIRERQNIQLRLEIFNVFSSWHSGQVFPNNRVQANPVGCTPGPGPTGACSFGSLVPTNGFGSLNLWNPRILQLSLKYSF